MNRSALYVGVRRSFVGRKLATMVIGETQASYLFSLPSKNIDDLIMNAGASGSAASLISVSPFDSVAGGATQASPAAEEIKKEEMKEESD